MEMTARAAVWQLARACAARAAGTGTASSVISAAAEVRDWPAAIDTLDAQGLTSLLAHQLGVDAPPELRARASAAAARSLEQFALLTALCADLEQAGIAVLPYKGPLLSLLLYGEPGLRQSTDIDLVVRRADFVKARTVLASRGFASRGAYTPAREALLFDWLGHATFGSTEQLIELHWQFAPRQFPFALSVDDALQRARPVRIGANTLLAMGHADLAVVLAMHGTRHLFERLEWLAGFWRAISDSELSAESLLEHARSQRARRMTLVAAGVALRTFAIQDAPAWRRLLDADPVATKAAERMHAQVEAAGKDGALLPDGAQLQRQYAELIDSPLDRARSILLAALLPTEREWEFIHLPDAALPMYRIIRPVRLLGRCAMRLLPGTR
jgi:hypothetical protein